MTEIIKKGVTCLVQGLLFGFGFCMAAWILYFVIQNKHHTIAASYRNAESEISYNTQENRFSFHEVEEVNRNGRTYFTGKIKNDGASAATGINIEINLFLDDRFVDQYSTYLSGNLKPEEERLFKISCGCKDQPPAEHNSYKIWVVNDY